MLSRWLQLASRPAVATLFSPGELRSHGRTQIHQAHNWSRVVSATVETHSEGEQVMIKQLKTRRFGAVLVGALTAALLLSSAGTSSAQGSTASADVTGTAAPSPTAVASPGTTTLKPPAIPGVSPLPGPVAKPAQPSEDMGILEVTPDQGVAGAPMTITGSQLPPHAQVELTWSTADATWLVQTAPDTVNYLGRSDTELAVVLDTTNTDAHGAFKVSLKAPVDWGGIHDIYAVIKGTEDAHGGFILLRTVTVSPKSGPVGTPITITYSGLGPTLYTGGASLLYDNHYVGELMANWTRGTAQVTIRATAGGPAHHPDRERHQLPVPERAPIADPLHERCQGHFHSDKGRRPTARIDRLARQRRPDGRRSDHIDLERPRGWQSCGRHARVDRGTGRHQRRPHGIRPVGRHRQARLVHGRR